MDQDETAVEGLMYYVVITYKPKNKHKLGKSRHEIFCFDELHEAQRKAEALGRVNARLGDTILRVDICPSDDPDWEDKFRQGMADGNALLKHRKKKWERDQVNRVMK